MNKHKEKFFTKELQDLHLDLQQMSNAEVASDEEKDTEENILKDIFSMANKDVRGCGRKSQTNLLQTVSATF